MGQFSFTHLFLLGLILLIFFGPSRLPSLGQSLGKAIRGFKDALNEIEVDSKPAPPLQTSKQNAPDQILHPTPADLQTNRETHNTSKS